MAAHLLVSLPPGLLFVLGSIFVGESPRWLYRKGRVEAAKASLLRSRSVAQAEIELREMEEMALTPGSSAAATKADRLPLLSRRYVVPFILACVILSCNTATGVNSVVLYNTGILLQSGLSDLMAHMGLRDFYHREFSDDDGRYVAGGTV